MARRGAHQVGRQDSDERGTDGPDDRERRRGTPRPDPGARWLRDDGAREWDDTDAPRARGRARGRQSRPEPADGVAARKAAPLRGAPASATQAIAALSGHHALPPEIATEIRNAADVATARHREHLVDRAESAYGAYERGRFQDALRAIKPVADEAPGVPAVRELAGLAAYRCGRWRSALGHLEAFGRLSDSAEHLPVLMDCQRALHKPKKVAALWAELRQSSPDPDVLAEGRIVAAASLADSGDLNGAIAMLSTAGASKALRNPSERHVRQWYLLADLYERAGDVPKAREYFERRVPRRPGGLRRRGAPAGPRPRAPAPGPPAQVGGPGEVGSTRPEELKRPAQSAPGGVRTRPPLRAPAWWWWPGVPSSPSSQVSPALREPWSSSVPAGLSSWSWVPAPSRSSAPPRSRVSRSG